MAAVAAVVVRGRRTFSGGTAARAVGDVGADMTGCCGASVAAL
jgi:hypothetical protein